jgi:hypothetical protein
LCLYFAVLSRSNSLKLHNRQRFSPLVNVAGDEKRQE